MPSAPTKTSHERWRRWALAAGGMALGLIAGGRLLAADLTVLHLKNGDRLAGRVEAEDNKHVVISTTWAKDLKVPKTEIARREAVPEHELVVGAESPGSGATNAPVRTAQNGAATTNGLIAGIAGPLPVVGVPAGTPRGAVSNHWRLDLRMGANFLMGVKNQEIYFGRAKVTYQRPYAQHPREYFRNITDYTVDYGRTEGVMSANRMDGSNKTDFDLPYRLYLYNLGSVGYDQIRKIDLRYEVGPGVGYRLLRMPNFTLNFETGLNYQTQIRTDGSELEDLYYRIAEEGTWKLGKQLSLTEKLEYMPQVNSSDFQLRFEATLSYLIWRSVSLNLTLLDFYDTDPAPGVSDNDLQIRSSIGVSF